MTKKLFTIAIALCMVLTMIPGGFQAETAWASDGNASSVKIAGQTLSADNGLYYYNGTDGAAGTVSKDSALDGKTPNAALNPETGTLTLNGLNYNGSSEGVYAEGNLNIAAVGENTIISGNYGIHTTGNLTISGNSKNTDKLYVKSSGTNAIFAYDRFQGYNESISISKVNIEALTESDSNVGIVAPNTVTIDNSIVNSTGGKYGIQGGYFAPNSIGGNGSRGFIIIKSSYVKAEAKSDSSNAQALRGDVTADGKNHVSLEKLVIIQSVHEHCICGAEHKTAGDHTEEQQAVFTEWTSTTSLPNEAGNYFLDDHVTLSEAWQPADGTVLCLNGKTITANGDFDAVTVNENVNFVLTDCSADDTAGTITHASGQNGRGVVVKPNGSFTMYNGNIDGNSYIYSNECYNPDNSQNSYGGGVCNDGTFTMNGGMISNNKVSNKTQNFGAGVFNYNGRSFNMNAGTIRNNEAGADGDSNNKGGGVYNAGTFTMKGGTIRQNTAVQGGGVITQVLSGTAEFIMSGGVIENNIAKSDADNTPAGGGVMVRLNGVFSVSGNAKIVNNTIAKNDIVTPNNVYLHGSNTITAGEMTSGAKIGVSVVANRGNDAISSNEIKASYIADGYFFSDDNEMEAYCDGDTQGYLKLKKVIKPQFTITFDANGGYFENTFGDEKVTMTVTSGDIINAPATAKKGQDRKYTYSFDGWYTAKEGGEKLDADTATAGETTYYAHWKAVPIEYKITYDPNGGKMSGTYKQTYTWDDKEIVLNASAEKPGYAFLGWATETGKPVDRWTITESGLGDLTFTAQWSVLSAVAPTVSLDKESLAIDSGSTATLTAMAIADKEAEYALTYQWYSNTTQSNKGGKIIEGATDAAFNIPSDTEIGTYYYYCVVTAERKDNGRKETAATNVATVTISEKQTSSSGGSYIQRPTIITDDGGDAKLSYNGRELTIAAKDGYEIADVLVNGVSKGAVTELTGLKTGDKVEIKTTKKADPIQPSDPSADNDAKIVKGVENTTITLKSRLTKNGKVFLTWTKSKGYKVDYFEFYRSTKKNSGYGKKAFFNTKDGSWSKYLNTKELKAGKTYYYKVRGVRTIDGKQYYTKWSNKAWRTPQ